MIDFNTIPTNEDWDNLIPGKYYPDNEYEDFYGKSYTEIVQYINQYHGYNIIMGLGCVSSHFPFYFYAMCILHAMQNGLIKPNDDDECFTGMLVALEIKIIALNVFREEFLDFVNPLKEILSGILDGSLSSDYDEEELAEVEERTLALIAEIERRYAECIAAENAAAAPIPDEEG